MNTQTHYWDIFFAWCLGLGFVFLIILVVAVLLLIDSPQFTSWQSHRQKVKRVKMHAELARKGMDPDYTAFLEKKINESK